MKNDDLLTKQLEALFSDVVPPEPDGVPRRQLTAAPPTALHRQSAVTTDTAQLPAERRLVHAVRQALPNWLAATLAAVMVLVALAFLLIKQESLAAPTTLMAPQSTRAIWGGHPTMPTDTMMTLATLPGTVIIGTKTPTTAGIPSRTPFVLAQPTATKTIKRTAAAKPAAAPTSDLRAVPAATINPSATAAGDENTDPSHSLELDPTITPPSLGAVEPGSTNRSTARPDPPNPAWGLSNTLVIRAINLEAPIVTVGLDELMIDGRPTLTWAVPDYFAVGWHNNSTPPGQPGNTVLNGHQYIHGGVFKDLTALQKGDEIIVYTGDTPYRYRVSERHVLEEEGQPRAVRFENARWIMPTADERLTLVTCAPHTKSTHRLIIVALPVQQGPSPYEVE